MTEGNPHEPRSTGVTIKYHKGYEASWAVFRGTNDQLRHDICDYFGLNVEDFQTLHDVVLSAQALAHGAQNAQSGLGARTVKPSEAKAEPEKSEPRRAEEEPAGPSPLLERIEEAESVEKLQEIWAKNQQEFSDDPDLLAAWKAKGRALRG